MASIKPIEQKSVHHIQSGQVIGDGLTSVVKELVENSFDASATSIEVRLKNYGLDSVEVVDNGVGITPDNYESIALKHWTSKLRSYDDLDNVTTFGFRGEALSSLCALADLQITTATADEAPKGTRLEFETSGKLKSRSIAAMQRGTTVLVENIFKTLPVRRSELERNFKREYTKVLGILQAYAGIYVGVKFSVFNQPPKGRKTPVFATKGNPTTRENIANVFGAKTLTALVVLDLQFEMKCTRKGIGMTRIGGGSESKEVRIVGHISRPTVGEGRQAPDRQMFFVNGRPCVLPQISKAFNEVYRTFNVTQSPFIFADIHMDTNAYDVNVSPDKRSILLHDQAELLESLKASLMEMFTNHEQTVPHTQLGVNAKHPFHKNITSGRPNPPDSINSLLQEGSKANALITMENHTTTASEILNGTLAEEAGEFYPQLPSLLDTPNRDSDACIPTAMTSPFSKLSYYPRGPKANKATITIGDRDPVITGSSPPESPSKRRKVIPPVAGGSKLVKLGKSGQPKFSSGALSRFAATKAQTREGERQGKLEEYDELGSEISEDSNGIGEETEVQELDVMILNEDQYTDKEEEEEEGEGEGEGEGEEGQFMDVNQLDELGEGTAAITARLDSDPDDDIEGFEEDLNVKTDKDMEPNEDMEDDDIMGEFESLKQSSIYAQELLRQAEDAAAEPTSKILDRAFEILKGSPKNSTTKILKKLSVSVAQVQMRSRSLTKLSASINARDVYSSNSTLTEDDVLAEERLNLSISKRDFLEMQVKGQFNKGFILTTRKDDLFIIDQHASDEKYNFETLQRETVVQNQRLVVPKVLELMAMDEVIVTEHLDIFKKNGFIIEVDPEAPTGARCRLISLPLSKETVFGIKDLEELIHLVHEDQSNSSVRCSKVRSMFAMRACKKSTKVGRALTTQGMQKIVRHMSELDKPWNCPHGRPTMRHLMELGQVAPWNEYSSESKSPQGLQWIGQSWADTWREYNGDE